MYYRERFEFDNVHSSNLYLEEEEMSKDSGSSSGVDELLSGMERLEQVEQMVGDCSGLLRAVKEAEQRADTKHAKDCLNKVEIGLDLIRQRVLTCAYYKLSVQEYMDLKSESSRPADPSVEFFGLEWSSVFSRCYTLGVDIRLLKSGLDQDRLNPDRLLTCLSTLHQLLAEIQMHAAALESGRLTAKHLATQLQQQQVVASVGRTASFNNNNNNKQAAKQQLKYGGSKTDSALLRSATTSQVKARRPSKTAAARRKSSLMDSFSNIFKVGLKI